MQKIMLAGLVMLFVLNPTLAREARANDAGFFSQAIPASACSPATAADAAKLELVNGSWAFISGQTGTNVLLICPVTDHWQDQSSNVQTIPEFELWYRDTDGSSSTATNVNAQLRFRGPTAGTASNFETSLSSSIDAATGNNRLRVTWSSGASAAIEGLYFFEVKLTRGSTAQTAALHGLSFLP